MSPFLASYSVTGKKKAENFGLQISKNYLRLYVKDIFSKVLIPCL